MSILLIYFYDKELLVFNYTFINILWLIYYIYYNRFQIHLKHIYHIFHLF